MKKYVYPAIFEKAEEGGYTVYFPDLEGCITEGDTIEEAFEYSREVLALHLDGIKDIPKPSKIEVLINCNNVVMLVDASSQDDIIYFTKNEFSEYFNDAVDKKGYTKYQIAQILGVDKSYIGRIAKGNRLPSVDMAKRLATLLDIDWRAFYSENRS